MDLFCKGNYTLKKLQTLLVHVGSASPNAFQNLKLENALKRIVKEDYFHSTFTFLIYIGSTFFMDRFILLQRHANTKETHQLHTILGGYFYFILMMTDDKCIFELNLNAHCTECGNVVWLI